MPQLTTLEWAILIVIIGIIISVLGKVLKWGLKTVILVFLVSTLLSGGLYIPNKLTEILNKTTMSEVVDKTSDMLDNEDNKKQMQEVVDKGQDFFSAFGSLVKKLTFQK